MATYTTIQGDMWDSIAYAQMGDCAYTDKLIELNGKYRDVFIFPAGVTLTLPEKQLMCSRHCHRGKQVNDAEGKKGKRKDTL